MYKNKFIFTFYMISSIVAGNLFAQVKLAQTGYQFLSVQTQARAAAMGNAVTTVSNNAASLFNNPASMAAIDGLFSISLSNMEWIANIEYNSIAIAYAPSEGQYGVFGFSLVAIDYGDDIFGTLVWGNNDGFIETEMIEASAVSVGFAYSRNLTEKFAVGGQVKYVAQHLGKSFIPGEGVKKNLTDVLAFDFGTTFKAGFKSLVLGMSLRNFSEEIKYENESFQLPLTFNIGLSAYASDFITGFSDDQSLLISIDAVHPRSFSEYINFGIEYSYTEMIALRAGFISAQEEQSISYGMGFSLSGFGIDYAFTPFGIFNDIHRFTLNFDY